MTLEPGGADLAPGDTGGLAWTTRTVAVPGPVAGPVGAGERVAALDVLRGVAVLGILGMNVYAFGLPWPAYGNPLQAGGTGALDLGAWWFTHLLFDMKFMTIFSMLFGAGLALMSERAEHRGSALAGVYYRRVSWLMLFGMLHGYLVWFGDILFPYALCGLALYPLRKLDPRVLLPLGAGLILVAIPLGLVVGHGVLPLLEAEASAAREAIDAGEEPTESGRRALEAWSGISPSPAELAREIEVYRNGYLGQVAFRAPQVFEFQTAFMLIWGVWRIGGLMVLGLGLMKLGVFSASRSVACYAACCLVGYGVGLPLIALGGRALFAHRFDMLFVNQGGFVPNYIGSLFVSAGHVGLVMLACKLGLVSGLTRRLAAVGRMALTHYLLQTAICTFLFYGWGLGMFGSVGRFGLLVIAAAIWTAELCVSIPWLQRFRFGPAEWLWRTLTYRRAQPLRV